MEFFARGVELFGGEGAAADAGGVGFDDFFLEKAGVLAFGGVAFGVGGFLGGGWCLPPIISSMFLGLMPRPVKTPAQVCQSNYGFLKLRMCGNCFGRLKLGCHRTAILAEV